MEACRVVDQHVDAAKAVDSGATALGLTESRDVELDRRSSPDVPGH